MTTPTASGPAPSGLAAWLVHLAVRRSWWTPLVPLLAGSLLLVAVTVGGQALGRRG